MAEESAAKSAWSLIMGTAENQSDGAQVRILLLLLLLIGIGLSAYVIYVKQNYIPPITQEATPQTAIQDERRLGTMIDNLKAANSARAHSMEIATAISSMARYPFVADVVAQTAEITPIGPQVVIIPPYIRLRATMTLEGKAVALLDIEGETSSRIYKVGDRFAERKGRISRIAPEKVTVVYEGKEFVYTP